MWKSITSNTRQMAALEEAFRKASSKFKISELNAYQKLAIAQHFNCTTWHHEVPHLFCDNCTADCKCGLPDCGAFASYPSAQEKENNGASITIKKRQVDAEQVDAVEGLLIQYYKTILIKLLNSTAHGDVRTLSNLKFMLGFTDHQITHVLDNLDVIFSLPDVYGFVGIWDVSCTGDSESYQQRF